MRSNASAGGKVPFFRPCWSSHKYKPLQVLPPAILKKASVKISSLKSVMLKKQE